MTGKLSKPKELTKNGKWGGRGHGEEGGEGGEGKKWKNNTY